MPKIISPTFDDLYKSIFTDAVDQEALDRPNWIQYKPIRFPNGSGYLHENFFNEINTVIKDGGGKPIDYKNNDLSNEFVIGDDSRADKLFHHYYNIIDERMEEDINYARLTDIHKNRLIEDEAKYLAGFQHFIESSLPENIEDKGKGMIYEQLGGYLNNRVLPAVTGSIKKFSAKEAEERSGDNWRRSFRTAFSSMVKQVGNMAAPIGDDYKEAAKELDQNEFRNNVMQWASEYDKKTEEDLEESTGIYNLSLPEASRAYGKGLLGLAWDKPNYVFNKAGEYVIQSSISSGVPRLTAALLSVFPGSGGVVRQGLRFFSGVALSSGGGFLQEGGAYYEEAVEQLTKARSRAQADAARRDAGEMTQADFLARHGLEIGSENEAGSERTTSYDLLTDNEIQAIASSQSKEYAAYATGAEIAGTLMAQWGANKTLKGFNKLKTGWIKSDKGQRAIAAANAKRWYKKPYAKVTGQLALEMFSEGATEAFQENMNMSMMEDMMPEYMRYTSLEKSDRLYEASVGGATGGLIFGGASMALTKAEDRVSKYREEQQQILELQEREQSARSITEQRDKIGKVTLDRNDQIVTIAMLADPTMSTLMPEVQVLTDDEVDASDYYLSRVMDMSWMYNAKDVVKILNSYGAKKIMKELGLTAEDFYPVLGNKMRVKAVFGKKAAAKSDEFFSTMKKDMTGEDNTDYSGTQESNNTNNERTLGRAFEELRELHYEAQEKFKKTKDPEDKKEVERLFKEMKKITANKDKRKAKKDIASKNTGDFVKDPESPQVVSLNVNTVHPQNAVYADDLLAITLNVLGTRPAKNPQTGKDEKQYILQLTQASQLRLPTTKKILVFESEIGKHYDKKGNLLESPKAEVKEKTLEEKGGVKIGALPGTKKPPVKKSTYEVSTKGDKRFSALNARLSDGRTIEEHYQVDVKGYKSIKEGKGKPPKDKSIDTYAEYKALWEQWADENPELIAELAKLSEGKTLTDMFAKTKVSQARALTDILIERGLRKLDKKPPVKKRKQKKYEDRASELEVGEGEILYPDPEPKGEEISEAQENYDTTLRALERRATETVEEVTKRMQKRSPSWTEDDSKRIVASNKKDLKVFKDDPIKYLEEQIANIEKKFKEGSYDRLSDYFRKSRKEELELNKKTLKWLKKDKGIVEEKFEKPIEKMFVTELKALAKKRGIDISGLKKKPEILKAVLKAVEDSAVDQIEYKPGGEIVLGSLSSNDIEVTYDEKSKKWVAFNKSNKKQINLTKKEIKLADQIVGLMESKRSESDMLAGMDAVTLRQNIFIRTISEQYGVSEKALREAIEKSKLAKWKARGKQKKEAKETLSSNDDFDSLISSEPDTEDIGESDIAKTAQNIDDELTGDDAPHKLADDEEEFKPFISWNRKGGLKGRDLRRAGAAFSTAWEQTKQRYGVDNTFFGIWSKMVSNMLSDSPLKSVFEDWVDEYSSDPSAFPVDPDTLVKEDLGLVGVSSLQELETLPFTNDEVQNWLHASTYSAEFIRESIGADSFDSSVGNSSTNNVKALNNSFFAVLGLTPTDKQQVVLYDIIRKTPSFEEFVSIISSEEFIKKNSFFLMSGKTLAQTIDENDSYRRIALRFFLNNSPVNRAKANRGKQSGTIQSLMAVWNKKKRVWTFVSKKIQNKGFFRRNKNVGWLRTRMIEKWGLDPDSYVYLSFDDLWGNIKYTDKNGIEKWGHKSFKQSGKKLDKPMWMRLFKSLIHSNLIPVVVRGDGNNMMLARIKKEHFIKAANYQTYWANEGITEDQAKSVIKMYIPEFNDDSIIDFFAQGSDNKFMAANIARHEMYKKIYGNDYWRVSGRDMQNRSKIALTPALSNPNMPSKKAMVFDSKVRDGENSNVTFRMKLHNGNIQDNKLVQQIDNMWQYVLDGMTMVSERVLAVDYPKYLGTKDRARRAKTVHYQRFGDGVMMNKHQEMVMWLPPWVDSAQIMDGDQVIAEFKRDEDGYLNIYDADGNYLDYLMSDDESKVRTGQYVGYNTPFDLMGEAIGLIQFPHEQEKRRAKFYPQLMNYFPEPAMQEAIMEMFDNPNSKRFHTAKSLFARLITISEDPKELDAYLLSHSGRLLEEESLAYILAAKLGAGFHSSGLENARRVLKNDLLEGITSFYNFGSTLDFRMDPTGSVTDDEVILPSDHSIVKNIVNRMKKEDGEEITIDDINDYLERKPTEVMVTRSPIPSKFGYRILRVKMVSEGMGDTFVVSPRVVKEVFEADGDGDKASIMFFDKDYQHVGNMFKRRQPKRLGSGIGISLKGDDREYNVGNIQDLIESMMAMQSAKGAIKEIGSFARQIGILSTWFKEMSIVDSEGNTIRISPRKLDESVLDEDMGETHSVSNLVRRYMQAAVDHSKLLLLDKWDYSQEKLLNIFFKKDDGSLLEEEEIKMIKQLLLNPITRASNLSKGELGGREIPFLDYFEISSVYEDYISQRHDEYHPFEDGSSVHIKGKEGANHFYDHLAVFFAKELAGYNKSIDFMIFSRGETQLAHMKAAELLQDIMPERIIKTALKQLNIKGKPTEADMAKITRHLRTAEVAAQRLTNEISNLTKKKEKESKEVPVDDLDEAENLFNINKWTYDEAARKVYEKWAGVYNTMTDAQRMAFTTAYLTSTASAEYGYRRKNPGLMPPASRGSDTVLGPNTVSLYYEYYNNALLNPEFFSKEEINEIEKLNNLYTEVFEKLGCIV